MALNVLATGIEFTPQGGSSVNLLDDYEEGSWTPAPNTGSFSGTPLGYYSLVGNICFIRTYLNGGSSFNLSNMSIPFTSAATNKSLYIPCATEQVGQSDSAANKYNTFFYIGPNTSIMYTGGWGWGYNWGDAMIITTSSILMFSGTFNV